MPHLFSPIYRLAEKAKIRPEGGGELRAEFMKLGVPEEWVESLMALGYDSVEKLKEVEKPGKLANDLNGYKVIRL